MDEKVKNIELTDENKLHLFCVAWHLTNLWEDTKKDTQGDAAANERIICDTCPRYQECWNKNYLHCYDHFNFLTEITGVKFSACANALRNIRIRETVKKLFIEDEEEKSCENH